jgi:hypothetical protein
LKARLLCLGLMATACSSVLGLETKDYTSTADALCTKYASLCLTSPPPSPPDGGQFTDAGLGGPGECASWTAGKALGATPSDACLKKTTCADFNDCAAALK